MAKFKNIALRTLLCALAISAGMFNVAIVLLLVNRPLAITVGCWSALGICTPVVALLALGPDLLYINGDKQL